MGQTGRHPRGPLTRTASGRRPRMLPRVLYDAWLSRGGAEGREPLDTPTEFKEGDEFMLGLEVYKVTGIKPGHDEYDTVLTAELIGDAPTLD
jgi:hypothetical protein